MDGRRHDSAFRARHRRRHAARHGRFLQGVAGRRRQSSMTEDEKAIRRLVADWFEATKRGDLDAVLALMTDDVVFLVPGKPPMMGKPAFAAASRAQAAH